MKTCTKCNETKDLSYFYKDKAKSDGLRPRCISCISDYFKFNNKNNLEWRNNYRNKVKARYKKMCTLKNESYHKRRNRENAYKRDRYKKDTEFRSKAIKSSCEYLKKRRKEDPAKRALDNVRNRVNNFLKRKKNSYSSIIGCKRDEFKAYIESKFQPGMNWDNYGKWHIDHIYPISLAFKEGEEGIKKACHFTNLQPLWALDNVRKSNKLIFR